MNNPSKQRFLSLDKKLLAVILAVNVLFTLAWSSFDLYLQEQTEIKNQNLEMQYIETRMIPVISGALWNLDRNLATVQLQAILTNPFVTQVRVFEGNNSKKPTIDVHKNAKFQNVTEKRYDLASPLNGEKFATLVLETTVDPLVARIQSEAWRILVSEALETLVLSLLILYAFRIFVLNHLSQISKYFSRNHLITSMTPHYQERNPYVFKDEIDTLIGAINRTVDDSKNYQSQIEELKNNAEKANEAKSMFLASVNHELRTPLNAILGVADILPEAVHDSENLQQLIDIQKRAGNHLLHLVDEILDFSKIEAGEVKFEISPFSLRKAFESVQTIMDQAVSARGNRLVFEIDPQLPERILGDSNRINQILINLVSNANKFTDHGLIEVRAQRLKNQFLISVKDSGIGIPKDKLSEIFLPFRQLKGERQKILKGTGIGLSITQRLVQLMNGKIEVQSQVGIGSEFRIYLPLQSVTEEESPGEEKPLPQVFENSNSNLKLLVVEDTPEVKLLIQAFLKGTGVQLSFAENGEEGLMDYLKDSFNLVLMDLQMPVMDGFVATQKIREIEKRTGHPHVPILALTALTTKKDLELALQSGCDGYVTKPFSKHQLLETLQKYAAS